MLGKFFFVFLFPIIVLLSFFGWIGDFFTGFKEKIISPKIWERPIQSVNEIKEHELKIVVDKMVTYINSEEFESDAVASWQDPLRISNVEYIGTYLDNNYDYFNGWDSENSSAIYIIVEYFNESDNEQGLAYYIFENVYVNESGKLLIDTELDTVEVGDKDYMLQINEQFADLSKLQEIKIEGFE